jgi:hypothetical protein
MVIRMLDLENGNWYTLDSGMGEAVCEIPWILGEMGRTDNSEFYVLAERLGEIICDQCAYNSTAATFPYLVELLKSQKSKKQKEKLLEMITVCIAWVDQEILEALDNGLQKSYADSIEELKRYVRILFQEYLASWNKEERRFWAISYITILGDKTLGSMLIGNYYECEIYCKRCGYAGHVSLTEDVPYDLELVDCMAKNDFDWLIKFLSEKDINYSKMKMFGFYQNFQCPQCKSVKKIIEFAKDFLDVQ